MCFGLENALPLMSGSGLGGADGGEGGALGLRGLCGRASGTQELADA